MRITLTAMGVALAVVGVRAGVAAFKRGSLPEIPLLMAATTKALVESLPGTPTAAAPTTGAQVVVSGPAVPDSGLGVAGAPDSTSATGQTPVAPPLTPVAPPPTESAALATPPLAAPVGSPAPLVPVVAEGRTELAVGMFAMRSGDTVTVYFDTPDARTRRADKFEQIVRLTLPAIHGSAADALLASVAPGALVGAVDLATELPIRGLHLRASDGRALSLWPETRPGRDGPLVVAYRVTSGR